MVHLASIQSSACVPVSLWQGSELLGWFRAKDLHDTGMQVTGPIEKLADDSIVTVAIEFRHQDAFSTLTVKALVIRSPNNSKKLWWVNQQAGVRSLTADSAQQYALPSTYLIRNLVELI